MESGNLADAQLRALIDVAAVAAGAHRLEEVLELAAERSLEALGHSSLAISRLEMETGIVRTLVNVGELGPGEERFPKDETYSVDDYPSMALAMREGGSSLQAIDDPDSDPAQRELLRRLGKESSLCVPMILRGEPWGELEVMTAPGRPRVTHEDEVFLGAIADQLVGAIHRAELFAQIEALAFTDSLTGLASRRAVETALEEACDVPSRPGSPALVLCDIDDLKQVNDTGGHAAGDKALCRAAEALVEAAAPHEDAVVGRFGGDEFCVLLPSGSAEDARALALDVVRRLDAVGGERISCGVAARTDEADRPAELLRAADEAQYLAKRAGHGVDVVVAGEVAEEVPPTPGHDRAYRAEDPDAQLARELLELLDNVNGTSADERLARMRARLEREA
ncbi:MAG TPA: sensor domain-containing diguanylate cyclase [Thermoleophilaceae bacterium]